MDTPVVLLAGLWAPSWVMIPLQMRLRRCGFRALRTSYASASAGLERNCERVARTVQRLGGTGVHLVGHSLGGVIALHATLQFELGNVQRIVMLGSPYVDSFAARKLGRYRFWRHMMGPTVADWLNCEKRGIASTLEIAAIAGTVAFGLGALLTGGMPRPHDGVVSVAETRVAGMKDFARLPVSHSQMLVSSAVSALTCRFLRSGSFAGATTRERVS